MSSVIVKICPVKEIKPHMNATELELAIVDAWQVVVRKGEIDVGDLVVNFPADSVLPITLSDRLNVTKYLSKQRVKAIRLRGEYSNSLAIPIIEFPEFQDKAVGENVADLLGVSKYEPPMDLSSGDMEKPHPAFHLYTEIENFRNFPDLIPDDVEVVVSEKLHGTNCRVGLIDVEMVLTEEEKQIGLTPNFDIYMAGSHKTRKKLVALDAESIKANLYWHPLYYPAVKEMLKAIKQEYKAKAVIMFSEVYGWVQDLKYGCAKGQITYAAFDISVDGKYLSYDDFVKWTAQYPVRVVPVVTRIKMGDLKKEGLDKYAEGNTFICRDKEEAAVPQMREGIVIKPVKEMWDPAVGRVILKYLSNEYLTRKGGTEYK